MGDVPLVVVILALWNLAVCGVYGWDKLCARSSRRRVPEKTLLLLAAVLGFVGAWAGVVLFRHKIRKPGFLLVLSLITTVWVLALWQWNPSLVH